MENREGELSKLVLWSLTNMRVAKTQFLPLSINLPNAAAVAIQIKIRDDFLCNIRRIRVSLGSRIVRPGSARRRSTAARKRHSKHRVRVANTGRSQIAKAQR